MTFDNWWDENSFSFEDPKSVVVTAWQAAREQCATELEAFADEIPDNDTDHDALMWAADMLRSNEKAKSGVQL